MIIDFHTHIFPPWIKGDRNEYIRRDACFSAYYSNPKSKIITAEELIEHMDKNEVDQSVVLNIGWVSNELCRETNDYILEAVSHYSDRLVAFCTVQPAAGEKAITEMLRCAEAGAKGLGEMRSDIQGYNLMAKDVIEPLINETVNKDLVFLTHSSEPVGHDYAGKGYITPEVLYPFIQMFPTLKIVCAHWGGGLPFYALKPEVDDVLTNVYFDTAATVWLYRAMIFQQVSSLVGSNKILFGSDYPLLRPSRIIAQIRNSQLGENDKAKILGDNAWKLLYRKSKESNSVAE